ncbi:MAG: hypothetical protein ABW085_16630, partial [Sedimenticola sp.]
KTLSTSTARLFVPDSAAHPRRGAYSTHPQDQVKQLFDQPDPTPREVPKSAFNLCRNGKICNRRAAHYTEITKPCNNLFMNLKYFLSAGSLALVCMPKSNETRIK